MTRRRALLAGAAVAVFATGAVFVSKHDGLLDAPPPPDAANDLTGEPLPHYAVARMGSVRRPIATSGLAFSADGKILRCGGADRIARDFDIATGAVLRERTFGGQFVEAQGKQGGLSRLAGSLFDTPPPLLIDLPWTMAFSPDGDTVATTGPLGAALFRGSAVRRHEREGTGLDRAHAVAIAPDGTRAAVAWQDGVLSIVSEHSEPRILPASGRAMAYGVTWSPDGAYLAVHGAGLQIVDADSGAVLASVTLPKDYSSGSVAWSRDGTRIAHASGRHALAMRDAKTLELVWETADPEHTNMGGVAISPDGKTVAWGTTCLHLVDAADGSIRRTLDTNGVEPWYIAWSPDGRTVAASCGGLVRMWDAATGEAVAAVSPPLSSVSRVEVSPDGSRVLSTGRGAGVDVWDAATGRHLRTVAAANAVTDAAWSPDGRSIRCVHWTTYPASILLTFDVESGTLTESSASANAGRYLLHGERPLVLRYFKGRGAPDVWDLADPRNGTAVRTLPGPVNGNAFSRDGRFVASTSGTPPLEFDDLTAGTKSVAAVKWSYDDGIARVVTFSPDASYVAFSTDRGRLYVADRAKDRKVLEVNSGLHGAITSLAVTSDGGLLAAGDAFGAIHLWSVPDEAQFPPLTGHRGPVWALDLSPDGTRLVSGSADATILVWDVSGFRPSR